MARTERGRAVQAERHRAFSRHERHGFPNDYIFKSEEKVQSPAEIKSVPIIEAGEYLLLSGEAAGYDIIPLVNSGKRRLGKTAGS